MQRDLQRDKAGHRLPGEGGQARGREHACGMQPQPPEAPPCQPHAGRGTRTFLGTGQAAGSTADHQEVVALPPCGGEAGVRRKDQDQPWGGATQEAARVPGQYRSHTQPCDGLG